MPVRPEAIGPARTVTAVIDSPVASERDLLLQILRGFGVISGVVEPTISVEALTQSLERFLGGLRPLGVEAEVRIRASLANRDDIIRHLSALNLEGRPLLAFGAAGPEIEPTALAVATPARYRLATAAWAAAVASIAGIMTAALLVRLLVAG